MSTSPFRPPRTHSSHPTVPPRIVEGGGTNHERSLLEAAQREVPPLASSAKVAAALKAAAFSGRLPEPPAFEAGLLQAKGAAGVPAKAWTVGVIGAAVIGGLVAGGWLLASEDVREVLGAVVAAPAPVAMAQEEPAPRATPESSDDLAAGLVAAAVASSSPPDEHGLSRTVTLRGEPPERKRAKSPPEPAMPPRPAPAQEIDLGAEVRAIESIQTLLGWGQTARARAALGDYRRRFPHGELSLEADLLDVDIAVASGNRVEARRLARALLERPSANRYRARLNALLTGEENMGSNRATR